MKQAAIRMLVAASLLLPAGLLPRPGLAAVDRKAEEVALRAIAAAGGESAFAATQDLTFRRTVIRYGPDGAERERVTQQVTVKFPDKVRVAYPGPEGPVVQGYRSAGPWMTVSGARATDPKVLAERVAGPALFLLFQLRWPLNLKDPGVVLEYKGGGVVADRPVHILSVTSAPGTGPTPEDQYLFYVNTETYQVESVWYWWSERAKTAQPSNQIFLEDYQTVGGVRRPRSRVLMPWPGRKAMEVLTDEYQVNTGPADTLFEPPPQK